MPATKRYLRLLVLITIPVLFVFGKVRHKLDIPVLIKKVTETPEVEAPAPDPKDYPAMLECVQNVRGTLKDSTWQIASKEWTSLMADSIFPFWYGTEWDFNGTTNAPGSGYIACGYFVSTTLKHSGIELNRYKLAQKAASDIVQQTCLKSSAKWHNSLDHLETYLEEHGEGLYVLGLDYHVGFVLRENGKNYFIHSDYFNGKVTREELGSSTAALSSGRYYLGSLSGNRPLLEEWLSGN